MSQTRPTLFPRHKLPRQLFGSYKKYKFCTETIINWLSETALDLGFILPQRLPPSQTAGRKDKGKAAAPVHNDGEEYTISTIKLEEMAQFVADYNASKLPIAMPKRVVIMGYTALSLRRRCGAWFVTQHEQLKKKLSGDKKAKDDANAEPDANEASIQSHNYFADVLERILDVLRPCFPEEDSKEKDAEDSSDKWHKMKRGARVRPPKQEKEDEGVEVYNEYDYLDTDEFDDEIFDTDDNEIDEEAEGKKSTARANRRQQSAARRKTRLRIRLESTPADEANDPLLQVFCLLEDLDNIRKYLKQVWAQFKADSSVDELMIASVLHNSAIDLVRRMVEEFAEENKQTYPTHESMISTIIALYCQRNNGIYDNERGFGIYSPEFAPIAEQLYLPMHMALRSFVQHGVPTVDHVEELVELGKDRSKMTLSELQQESELILLALIPDLLFFSGPPQWLVIHDDISRGIGELLSNAMGMKEAPRKEIRLNKNNKTNDSRSRYSRTNDFDASQKYNSKAYTITNNDEETNRKYRQQHEEQHQGPMPDFQSEEMQEQMAGTPIPLWLSFACQTMVDVLFVMGTQAPRARACLLQRSLEIRAMVKLHFDTVPPCNLNEPETAHSKYLKAVEGDLATLSDAALEWGIRDGIQSQKDFFWKGLSRQMMDAIPELPVPSFWLFDHHPMLCGLLTYSFTLALQGMSIQYINTYCTVMYCAQVYNAAKQTLGSAIPGLEWHDMDTLIELHTPKVFFAGTTPKTIRDCYKRSLLVCGTKTTGFASRKASHQPRSLQETLKVGAQALLSDSSPVTHLLHERYCHHAVRANGALDFSMPVLKELIGAYHKGLSAEQAMLVGGEAIAKTNSALQPPARKNSQSINQKLTTVQLLNVLRVCLQNERMAMTFDYISMHRQIVGLLTKILNALRPDLIKTFGMYPMLTFESGSGIIHLCTYILDPSHGKVDRPNKLLVKAARIMAEWLNEQPSALGPMLNRIHCVDESTTNGTLDLSRFNRRRG